jgi:hypothetical protein
MSKQKAWMPPLTRLSCAMPTLWTGALSSLIGSTVILYQWATEQLGAKPAGQSLQVHKENGHDKGSNCLTARSIAQIMDISCGNHDHDSQIGVMVKPLPSALNCSIPLEPQATSTLLVVPNVLPHGSHAKCPIMF